MVWAQNDGKCFGWPREAFCRTAAAAATAALGFVARPTSVPFAFYAAFSRDGLGDDGPVGRLTFRHYVRARAVGTAEHTRARGSDLLSPPPVHRGMGWRAIERSGAVRRRNVYAPRSPPQRERLRKRFGPRPLGPVCVSAVPTWRPPKTASICKRLGRGGGKRPADKLHRTTERRCERTRARRCFFLVSHTHTHTHMAVPMFAALPAINFVLCLLSSSSHGKRFRRTRTVSVPVSFALRHRRTKPYTRVRHTLFRSPLLNRPYAHRPLHTRWFSAGVKITIFIGRLIICIYQCPIKKKPPLQNTLSRDAVSSTLCDLFVFFFVPF